MRKQLESEIDIEASAERVWQVLTDFSSYPEWNPFITQAEGQAVVGGRLTLRMQPVGGRAATVHPTVLEATPVRELRWLGTLGGVPGLMDAEHVFTLSDRPGGPAADGSPGRVVRLTQREGFRGLLVPAISRSLERHTLPAFHAMNRALKHRAEHTPALRRG
jgi:hypothetical protein